MTGTSANRHALVFLGPEDASHPATALACEGEVLSPGAVLPLARVRSPPWHRRPQDRVIVGSDPARADVLLAGDGIRREHLRVYIWKDGSAVEMRPLDEGSTRVNGRLLGRVEEVRLDGGERLALGPWLFRFRHASEKETERA
jgi:hypothetical protein